MMTKLPSIKSNLHGWKKVIRQLGGAIPEVGIRQAEHNTAQSIISNGTPQQPHRDRNAWCCCSGVSGSE